MVVFSCNVDPLLIIDRLVRASSLNCYLFEPLADDDSDTRASLVTQQMQLADPCTFRLIVKVFGSVEVVVVVIPMQQ